jgi:hypothetical protein
MRLTGTTTKRLWIPALLLVGATSVQLAGQSSGGSFQITNSVISSGGANSTDGTVNGLAHEATIGEHAAGTLLRNPPYSLISGFRSANVGLIPTAASATISGQILTSNGSGIGGVVVLLNGPRNSIAITNANGFYAFADLETGGFYTVTASLANYHFTPATRSISLLGSRTDAVFTAFADATPTANPLDTAEYFVRQQYLDFLGREPDQGGFEYWSAQINQCLGDQNCIRLKRVDVSNAFFFEQEYQRTGSYVFRLYRAAFGNAQPLSNPDQTNPAEARKLPSYAAFAQDRARVVAGANLIQLQMELANLFMQRSEFVGKYPASLDGPAFVDALMATISNDSGVDLTSQRNALIELFRAGGRGAVLYRLADDDAQNNPINNRAFIDAEYNRAFVFTEYAGYLRRDSDILGFLFWLDQVNRAPLRFVPEQHQMVCAFINSAEYQQRFSSVVTRSNADCPQ